MNQPHFPFPALTVIGNGKVIAQANAVQLQIEVITKGNDVSDAQQENANNMHLVIQAIIDAGVPQENIQTAIYTISPTYVFTDGKQVFSGFEVINAISVKINDIDQVGEVIDTAVQNGANRISSLQFTVENPDYYYQQALQSALQNAQMKAKTVADTMQLALYPQPVEILEESASSPPIFFKTEALSSTPIEQGQLSINAAVRVTYRY